MVLYHRTLVLPSHTHRSSSSDHSAGHHTVPSSYSSNSSGSSSVTTPSRSATADTPELQQIAVSSPFFAAVRNSHTTDGSSSSVSGVLVRPAVIDGHTTASSSSHTATDSSNSSISSGLSALRLRRRSQSADARGRPIVGCSSADKQLLQTP